MARAAQTIVVADRPQDWAFDSLAAVGEAILVRAAQSGVVTGSRKTGF